MAQLVDLKAPFPWFGGKRRVAAEVWARFGNVQNYVEPFFGSGAVLLGRPSPFSGAETVNDLDGFVANFWRSVKLSPDAVAEHADQPVFENDLHARHVWLLQRRDSLRASLEGDPDWHDPKIAGWWAWGVSSWIGGGFCSGKGPWQSVGGRLVSPGTDGKGVSRRLPHLSDEGQGVNRKRPHLSDEGQGVSRRRPHLSDEGQGVNRRRPHLGNAGQGVNRPLARLGTWFQDLADRLRGVRVCSGDWSRVCGTSVLRAAGGVTGVFLDPPYADTAGRCEDLYAHDSLSVAHDVREWAIANGSNPTLRIALCGYEGEHEMPKEWSVHAWKAHGGYGSQGDGDNENARRERIWFSPACLGTAQLGLFAGSR